MCIGFVYCVRVVGLGLLKVGCFISYFGGGLIPECGVGMWIDLAFEGWDGLF